MVSPDSAQMSREFFENPSSYAPFTLTADHRLIVACIEPRDQEGVERGEHKVTLQTSGGAAGEGLDGALALTVTTGGVVPIETAIDVDKRQRPLTVFGAHYRCKFIGAIEAVLEEMAAPTEFTIESAERWGRALNQWEDQIEPTLGRILNAAEVELDYIRGQGHMEHLIEHADRQYPAHANVAHVRGDNIARVYVVGMHPHIGKNRNAKPGDPETASQVQGYHDSLAATVLNLRGEPRLTNEHRGLRLTSMVLRAAAARTVITRDILPEMTFYEVQPADTPKGLEVVEHKV